MTPFKKAECARALTATLSVTKEYILMFPEPNNRRSKRAPFSRALMKEYLVTSLRDEERSRAARAVETWCRLHHQLSFQKTTACVRACIYDGGERRSEHIERKCARHTRFALEITGRTANAHAALRRGRGAFWLVCRVTRSLFSLPTPSRMNQ